MILCPLCSAENSPDAATCALCGGALAALSPTASALALGTRLSAGAYSVGRVLGQGGFGITYLGSDTHLRRPVAIKEFFPVGEAQRRGSLVQPNGAQVLAGPGSKFEQARAKFLEEARVLARFSHAGIVNVFSSFEENNTAYMAMELLRGQSLMQKLEAQGALPEGEAISIIEKAGAALSVVHEAGLLHRDIKPDNIMVEDGGRVVLIDFGTARQFAVGHTRRMTAMLTIGYAPLEQYTQSARFGIPTDIYALAATLYHCLTGSLPTPPTDRVSGVPLTPPHRMRHAGAPLAISRGLSEAVMWALEIKASDRPQDMREWLLALRSTKTSPSAPQPQRSGRSSGVARPDPSQNPLLPAMLQVLAAAPPSDAPPDAHAARLQELEVTLAPLQRWAPPPESQCPSCSRPGLQTIRPQALALGQCPLCRNAKLTARIVDENLCALCRSGELQEMALGPAQMMCPLCKVASVQEEGRRVLGFRVEHRLRCSGCHACWNLSRAGQQQSACLIEAGTASLSAGVSLGQERAIQDWRDLSGRTGKPVRCSSCRAQFDEDESGRLALKYFTSDPHGVGARTIGKSFVRRAWANLAIGLPLGAGDHWCPGCHSEWSFKAQTQTLILLRITQDQNLRWAAGWAGKPLPLPRWNLALIGKKSLWPGVLCSLCDTEFDLAVGAENLADPPLRLARASSPVLAAHRGQVLAREDWQRLARGLPLREQEQQARAAIAQIQQAHSAQREQWQRAHDQAAQERGKKVSQMLKDSWLSGHISFQDAGASASGPRLKDDEWILWSSQASEFRQRSREGVRSWSLERSGRLVVTNQRLWIEDAPERRSWLLKNLDEATITWDGQRSLPSAQPLLQLRFSNLKKPIAFQVADAEMRADVGGHSCQATLTASDLALHLQTLTA